MKILDVFTLYFFPESGQWYSECFNKPNELDMRYLNCHLRDEEWLAKMLQKRSRASYEVALNYVKTSPYFSKKRREYELKVVKWQIEYMMKGGGNWKIPKGHPYLTVADKDLDERFRGGVVETLTEIGMDPNVVEEGLEIYSSLWRSQQMEKSFKAIYEPQLFSLTREYEDMPSANKDFKDAWIAFREFRYYNQYRDVVDRCGSKTPAMGMSKLEAMKVATFLKEQHDKRMEFINNFKQNNYIPRGPIFGEESQI